MKTVLEVPNPTRTSPTSMSTTVRLLRVKQWSKNLLVFAAFIFAFDVNHLADVWRTLGAFFAMSLVSSATYIANDWRDVEKDRAHPKKKYRPIANRELSASLAIGIGIVCLACGICTAACLGRESLGIVLAYLLLQVAYNLKLKRVSVADVYVIATGFVLRAALGAAAIHVTISGWLLFCTGALALMLGFGKRRAEMVLQGEDAARSRESLEQYNALSLNALVIMSACFAAMSYGIYVLESATARKYPGLIVTSPFVFYGITRYILLVFTSGQGGEPEDMLVRDKQILASVVLFLISSALCLIGLKVPLLEVSNLKPALLAL